MTKVVSSILLAALGTTAVCATTLVSPGIVDARIHSVGAQRTVSEMSDSQFDAVAKGIASGTPQWLHVAAELRGGTDGSSREGIDGALSSALTSNAAGVLRLVNAEHDLSASWLCQDRTIEASAAHVRTFTSQATAALRRVSDPKLQKLRNECIASLNTSQHTAS